MSDKDIVINDIDAGNSFNWGQQLCDRKQQHNRRQQQLRPRQQRKAWR